MAHWVSEHVCLHVYCLCVQTLVKSFEVTDLPGQQRRAEHKQQQLSAAMSFAAQRKQQHNSSCAHSTGWHNQQ
jgi:hypothetical protein